MRAYLTLCEIIILWIVVFGFLLPWLYSNEDTTLVGIAFGLTLATIPIMVWLIRSLITSSEVQKLWSTIKTFGEKNAK